MSFVKGFVLLTSVFLAPNAMASVAQDPAAYADVHRLATMVRAGSAFKLTPEDTKKLAHMRETHGRLYKLCKNNSVATSAPKTIGTSRLAITAHDNSEVRDRMIQKQITSAPLRLIDLQRAELNQKGALLPSQSVLEKDPSFRFVGAALSEPHKLRENVMSVFDLLTQQVKAREFYACVKTLEDFTF